MAITCPRTLSCFQVLLWSGYTQFGGLKRQRPNTCQSDGLPSMSRIKFQEHSYNSGDDLKPDLLFLAYRLYSLFWDCLSSWGAETRWTVPFHCPDAHLRIILFGLSPYSMLRLFASFPRFFDFSNESLGSFGHTTFSWPFLTQKFKHALLGCSSAHNLFPFGGRQRLISNWNFSKFPLFCSSHVPNQGTKSSSYLSGQPI